MRSLVEAATGLAAFPFTTGFPFTTAPASSPALPFTAALALSAALLFATGLVMIGVFRSARGAREGFDEPDGPPEPGPAPSATAAGTAGDRTGAGRAARAVQDERHGPSGARTTARPSRAA